MLPAPYIKMGLTQGLITNFVAKFFTGKPATTRPELVYPRPPWERLVKIIERIRGDLVPDSKKTRDKYYPGLDGGGDRSTFQLRGF